MLEYRLSASDSNLLANSTGQLACRRTVTNTSLGGIHLNGNWLGTVKVLQGRRGCDHSLDTVYCRPTFRVPDKFTCLLAKAPEVSCRRGQIRNETAQKLNHPRNVCKLARLVEGSMDCMDSILPRVRLQTIGTNYVTEEWNTGTLELAFI